ncbi:MAG: carbon monoxide dehydrogenase maturation protein [Chloroflexi bacterium]|nr:MAG: carbon monoxide dehydrogenase maturation protein [Chloroflexota bacterium]RLC96222.1 MAG: carbon monoxide dehydrogenase maturation protein [Chloroflexota bacterium]
MTDSTTPSRRLVAICGKGGTGKTMFTALIAKVLLETKKAGRLLLIDADPAMNLPNVLGVEVSRTMGGIREDIIRTARSGTQGDKRQLAGALDYMTLEALCETEDLALLAMGRTETLGCFCPVNDVLRGAIETLSKSFDTTIIDGEAGLEQLNRQVMRGIDTLVIVSDATSRGLRTAAMIKGMVENERVVKCQKMGLVFNRVAGSRDLLQQFADDTGLPVLGYIPHDDSIAYYDLVGKPIRDLPDCPGLEAVRAIVRDHLFADRFS